MTDFKTNNQDKSNLVGDAKLMSDAVDREQADIKRKDELLGSTVFDIFDENKELKELVLELQEKAKAWGNLEALCALHDEMPVMITKFLIGADGSCDFYSVRFDAKGVESDRVNKDLKVSISNALESIRGES